MKEPKTKPITAKAAAQRLGVKVETIYAYVSRGLLTRVPGGDKESRFELADVERLRARGRRTSEKPEQLVVMTALTEATSGALFYRGKSALELSAALPFERVAEWVWAVPEHAGAPFVASKASVALARAVHTALPDDALPLERLRVIATVLGSTDALKYEMSESAVVATARALIAGMVEALPRRGDRRPNEAARDGIAERLFVRLSSARPSAARVRALDVAMGLCVDHALSPSTLAVRVAASQRADPYGVVQTGMGALGGMLHGAASLSAEELISEVAAGMPPDQAIGARLRRSEKIPGFGHALHTSGDPRARALLAVLAEVFPRSRALNAAAGLEAVMRSRGLPLPNIDWALAALACAAEMRRGASEAIMAIARVAGWIAHALEEYRAPTQIPWRVLYVGPKA